MNKPPDDKPEQQPTRDPFSYSPSSSTQPQLQQPEQQQQQPRQRQQQQQQQQQEGDEIQPGAMVEPRKSDIQFLLNKQESSISRGRAGRRASGSSSRAPTPGARGGVERGASAAKPFQCRECGRAFKEKGNLNKHVASVHEKRKTQACPHCAKLFAFKDGLVRHISQVHLNERPFHCPPCRQWFKQLSHLAKHNKTIHKK